MSSASSSSKQNTQNSQKQSQQQQTQSVKLLKSLNKFSINKHQYYVAMIRKTCGTSFRLSIIDKNACWTSSELQFEKIRNEALSGTIEQFRNHLIRALSNPNDDDYDIEQIIDKDTKHNTFKIKVIRKSNEFSVLLASIKLYHAKKRGTNLFYVLEKASITIKHQKSENVILRKDNMNFKKKYDECIQQMDEVISVKNKQEQELLSKFVMILNEKKKQIRNLWREINTLKGNTNDNSEDMILDDEIKDFGINVSEHNDDQYGNSNNTKKAIRNLSTDELLQVIDINDGFSIAADNIHDDNIKEVSPSFGSNAMQLKRKKKKQSYENESQNMEDIEDKNMSNRKKRKREYVDDELLQKPVNKKRKVSHKKEKESNDSDSSFDFNTSDLM